MCTSGDTFYLPAFLIYVLFAERTDSVIYDNKFTLLHPVPNGLVFDLPSEGVSQMLSILIKTLCGEIDVDVTREHTPIVASAAAATRIRGASGKRQFSTTTASTKFKYLVDVDNGRLKIYVQSLQELKDLRRQLLDGTL